jgi:hypothetical protein
MKKNILEGAMLVLVLIAISCIGYGGYWIVVAIKYGVNGDFSSGLVSLFIAMEMAAMAMFPLLGALGILSKIHLDEEK